MSARLRVLSAGGWVANTSNQLSMSMGFGNQDTSIRPSVIFLMLAIPGIFVVFDGVNMVRALANGALVTAAAAASVAALFGFIDLWIVLGWRAGFVPFRADPTLTIAPAAPPKSGSVPARLTGVVLNERSEKRRYRVRPATLEFTRGSIRLDVATLQARFARARSRNMFPAAMVRLDREDVVSIEPGTTYLVTGARPAIRLRTPQGNVLLTFDSASIRGFALGALLGWNAGMHASEAASEALVAAGVAPEPDEQSSDAVPLIDLYWYAEIAFGILVGSLVRLVAYDPAGQTEATAAGALSALLGVLAWELGVRLGPRTWPRHRPVFLVAGAALAAIFVCLPLDFHVGSGPLASAVLIGLSLLLMAAVAIDTRRK